MKSLLNKIKGTSKIGVLVALGTIPLAGCQHLRTVEGSCGDYTATLKYGEYGREITLSDSTGMLSAVDYLPREDGRFDTIDLRLTPKEHSLENYANPDSLSVCRSHLLGD